MNRRDIFHYTKIKISTISIAIVFLCLFVFALIIQFLYSSRIFNSVDKQLLQQKSIVEHMPPGYMRGVRPPLDNNRFLMNPPTFSPNIIIGVFVEDVLIGVSPNSYFEVGKLPVLGSESEKTVQDVQYEDYNFRGISFKTEDYSIQFLVNVDSEIKSIKQLNNSIIISLIMLVIIAFVLSIVMATKIIKPVRKAYDKQVYFVQDASHEMRTPLAVIKGKLEILANSWGETIDDNFEHISKMMSEVRGLEKLNNDLLLLTKEDIDSISNIEKINLNKFIEEISDFYVDLAEMQNKEFKLLKPINDIDVQWDYAKMKRLVVILLENAFKYTPPKGKIELNFEDSGKFIRIVVCDTGIGIRKEEQTRIFDRFFRSADERVQNINGSGIGLSLLKSISKTLGVTIKFTSECGIGTEFKLLIPKIMK